MRLTVTGATGLIGSRVVGALAARGDEVTVLSRSPQRAGRALGVAAAAWRPTEEPAPADALHGRDAVVHLAGEPLDQRWTDASRRRIRESRELGTRNLLAGVAATDARPGVLVSASAVGFYGDRGEEILTEEAAPGLGFPAEVCQAWEREAARARELGMRVAHVRTGVVLAQGGGALARMLPPFKLGVGGPVAGGHQYLPWIHVDDVVGLYLAVLDDDRYEGPVNASAPEPVTNRDFSKALGRALHRPAVAPVPALALKVLYGDMAEIVLTGQRAVPAKAQGLGFAHRHPELHEALRSALG
jgi:uncharacterized protein (TIGR01777 family)